MSITRVISTVIVSAVLIAPAAAQQQLTSKELTETYKHPNDKAYQ
jgi:hypothetical protein